MIKRQLVIPAASLVPLQKQAVAQLTPQLLRQFLMQEQASIPEVRTLVQNPMMLKSIGILFQGFANNSERLSQFFFKLRNFLAQYDTTPRDPRSYGNQFSTTPTANPNRTPAKPAKGGKRL